MPEATVLVANRGEIAVRIIRACHELGLRAAAVHSDADAGALHVRLADEAHRIGPPPARASYLDVDAVLGAAKAAGASLVHPGYGFLERGRRVRRSGRRGRTGVRRAVRRGHRRDGRQSARARGARKCGVPVPPGTADLDGRTQAAAEAEPDRLSRWW